MVIVGVIAYNTVQERRARKRAESAFGEGAGDALFEPAAGERLEPTLGALPGNDGGDAVLARAEARPLGASEELAAAGGPEAEISTRIDTVAVILADDPVTSEQLEPLEHALEGHTAPVLRGGHRRRAVASGGHRAAPQLARAARGAAAREPQGRRWTRRRSTLSTAPSPTSPRR